MFFCFPARKNVLQLNLIVVNKYNLTAGLSTQCCEDTDSDLEEHEKIRIYSKE
jgi:hypothetical protein